MKLTTKGRYAVTAMLDLALHNDKGPVTLADIADRQGISLSYLEQLFAKLRKQKLVEGVRGPGGGYRLARMPHQITVAEIINAVDEAVDVTRCQGEQGCQEGQRCLTHELWQELSQRLYEFLDSITPDQFIGRPEIKEIARRQDEEAKRMNFVFPRPAA